MSTVSDLEATRFLERYRYLGDRLKGLGFVADTDASNGCGVVVHYRPRALGEEDWFLLQDLFGRLGLERVNTHIPDSRTWVIEAMNITVDFKDTTDGLPRLRTQVVSHPNDAPRWLQAQDREWNRYV